MSCYTLVGELPRHHYCYVDTAFTHREPVGFVPCVWFGLVSHPGRVWGCTVMLESGAVYRNVPAHAIAFSVTPQAKWGPQDAQTWDCYGERFTALEYRYLAGLECRAKTRNGGVYPGEYLFTAAPVGDGFSAHPGQAKEFYFLKLENGRLTIQPTNHVVMRERSFTTNDGMEFPSGLKRQDAIYSAEGDE